jgi:hypothetical protein
MDGEGGRGGSRGEIDGEYDTWDPHVVVGVEYELQRLTGAEKLELNWKFWTTRREYSF